uniref:Uncharacterized protein n=1 Tax=Panagrolaimus sp. PS1159 TaxID=55785 RepID=A0AC35EZZ9_9BILA
MTDSDDSFHSASEGEDGEITDNIKEIKKLVDQPPLSPVLEQPKKELDLEISGRYDDANQSAEWTKRPPSDQEQQSSPELPNRKHEDGWEDWGAQADTEGDSEPEVEKIETSESEYFHRQLMDPKKIPSSSRVSSDKEDKDDGSKGLFDWSAIQNVVSAVGEGISNVVESGLGIPPPEEAAKLSVAQRRKILEDAQACKEPEPLSSDEGSGQSPEGSTHHFPMHEQPQQQQNAFGGFFGGLVNGSLDVLETIGKKTFETLTIKNDDKRRFILQPGNDQNLSEILRELKETEANSPPHSPTKMLGYGSIFAKQNGISFLKEFEEFDGFVHLECFELLSKDYFAEKVANKQFSKFDEQLATFCLEDVSECLTEEFLKEIKKQSNKFNIGYKPIPLINANEELTEELTKRQQSVDKGSEINVEEFHRYAIVALAKLTSKAIECLCRLVQQMIVAQSRPDLASVFAFSYLICRRLSYFSTQYANLLSLSEQNTKVEEIVTNIFFECSNACHYLKKALELARPFFPDDGFIFDPTVVDEVNRPQYARKESNSTESSSNNDWVEW